jgi:uncharacterized protein (DUF1778 family)
MATTIYPLRLSPEDRKEMTLAARRAKQSLAEFLRDAGRERAHRIQHTRAAILTYRDDVQLSSEAEQNPKAFIRRKLEAKRELYR